MTYLARVDFFLPKNGENYILEKGNNKTITKHLAYTSILYHTSILRYKLYGIKKFLICASEEIIDKNGEQFLYIFSRL